MIPYRYFNSIILGSLDNLWAVPNIMTSVLFFFMLIRSSLSAHQLHKAEKSVDSFDSISYKSFPA